MSNRPIADCDTPDPWLIASPLVPGIFYLTFTLGNRIEVWSSPSLESFHNARKSVIWQPAPGSPWSGDIWAPELHFLFGTWYIYAAAAHPDQGNPSHRTIVLRCTNSDRDPMNDAPGSWVFEGPLKGLPPDQWSIDATVFSPDPGGYPDEQRRWYVCYSGWPLGDHSDTQQDLFLARLKSPLEADGSTLTCISRAELDWERPEGGRRGVNEGPTWVNFSSSSAQPHAGHAAPWKGIVYSAHGSWTCEYKLAILQFAGSSTDDLCKASLWRKRATPLLVSDRAMGGPFGPGHASFVYSPHDDGRVFCVYHGTEREDEGWANRKGRVISLEQACFGEHAKTVCCAYAVCGPVGDTHGVLPGQPGEQSQMGASSGGGGAQFGRYLEQVEKRIPAQYQGYWAKAKKFFP